METSDNPGRDTRQITSHTSNFTRSRDRARHHQAPDRRICSTPGCAPAGPNLTS
jgi:hypothetical protein